MTDSLGTPVANDTNSLTVSCDGPGLLQDVNLIDKIAHFDRERIPERVVHAKGAGAFGYFQNYCCMSDYTIANFLQVPNTKTPVFVRFSTVIGSKGSADTVRDPRGFAVKFYTCQGTYDIVGNNLPVFFIRDAIKFPDVIHSLKPAPHTNLRDPRRFWDFISLTPESTHMITWLYSDRGTIDDYTHMDGFSVNTYVWVNKNNKRFYIKYHWKTVQGLKTIDRFEAERLAGSNPDIATEKLYNKIACGKCPKWELCVQVMDPDVVDSLDFDPLDDTKTWPEDQFPLIRVGMMILNKNPDNFFAQVEQSAFCPGNLVPGVDISADKMLVGRSFSYFDAQRYRLGANFADLPINRSISPINNNQRDGAFTYHFNPEPINYSPNSLNCNKPVPASRLEPPCYPVKGLVKRCPIEKTNDFAQAGEHYCSLTSKEKEHLIDNIASELYLCKEDIICRVLDNFCKASEEFGCKVKNAVSEYKNRSCS
ncbi:MAG: catalase [Lachnospiraceae bacterium]|nr:catalase [Lachnospiraceae bacterium]